ncbi:hypothetical protein GTV32_02730 [Gordonia sp. SID5947]|uniref:hypothetical protein n=1 Tax=Gordonia sp. SID5947 TaxID=2690315 RepID=UPI001370AFC6|nr:hypothetical protein [Gordonia sp. SID5947]MYR05300.1 hypothetical protein [Gordonia sp. SID5947]
MQAGLYSARELIALGVAEPSTVIGLIARGELEVAGAIEVNRGQNALAGFRLEDLEEALDRPGR